MAETDMLHNMLRYSEVSTDLEFVDIATKPLDMCSSVKAGIINARDNNSNVNGGTNSGKI